jgi:hydrogenase maturation protease
VRPDLVIGIGNPLRGDDGVGALLLEELAREGAGEETTEQTTAGNGEGTLGRGVWSPHGAVLKAVHQLTPELALAVAEAGRVLFVDAWANPDRLEPWIAPLPPPPADGEALQAAGPGGHGWGPLALVSLAEVLYGWRGEAALLRVPAFAFPHGTDFSASLERALPLARALVRRWLRGG